MAVSPLEAEATGQEFIAVAFRGHEFRVPLDVDSWPLQGVSRCLAVKVQTKEFVVRHEVVAVVLERLLGPPQWAEFLRVAPKRRHLAHASNVLAEAAGFPARGDQDLAFGALPWLLAVIEQWPTKVESDLDRFWNIDYGHRFLFQQGRRRLTLRKIHARLMNLPIDSSLAIAMNDGKLHRSGEELVLMDLYEKLTGQRHPSRPMSAQEAAMRDALKAAEDKAISDRSERMRKRKARSGGEAALNNARENALRAMRRDAHAQEQD